MRRKGWQLGEEKLLIENYKIKTIFELIEMFSKLDRPRNKDSINAKIKRLKAEGRIEGGKTEETITRSLKQR
jgi:hypothetical protein